MDHAPEDSLLVSESDLQRLALQVLQHLGLSEPHAQAIARIVVAGQRDACQSHGAYRILSAAHTIRTGMVDLQARPLLQPTQGAITRVDAQRGFSPWALEVGLPPLVATTRKLGMGALVINHCVHFTALWPEVGDAHRPGPGRLGDDTQPCLGGAGRRHPGGVWHQPDRLWLAPARALPLCV